VLCPFLLPLSLFPSVTELVLPAFTLFEGLIEQLLAAPLIAGVRQLGLLSTALVCPTCFNQQYYPKQVGLKELCASPIPLVGL